MRRDLLLAGATLAVVAGALVSLTRVFSDGSWAPTTAAAVLLAVATAAGARRVGFGAVAATVASAVGLSVFTYVVHLPAGPLLPGPEQLGQAIDLFAQGLVDVRDRPAPTVPLPGLLLIVTTAAWVVTHVTHELLVRWARPGMALIPAAVLWIVPLAVPLPPGRSWPQALPFLAGAALVLLLEADTDVAGFSRDVDGPRLSGTGAAVGACALAIAAFAPGVLPGYDQAPWVDLTGANDPRGYQPIVDVGDRLKLPAERPVLAVRAERPSYLRLAALETFDDNTWRLGPPDEPSFRPDASELFRADDLLPPEVPISERTETFVGVQVLDLSNIYVPVPYQPLEVLGPDRDRMVYSTVGGFVATGDLEEIEVGGDLRVGVVEGLEYRVRATIPTPTIDQLRRVAFDPATIEPYLQLPRPYEDLAAQAQRVYDTAGAATAVDRAFALQEWFAGADSEFVYATDVDVLRGSDALRRFVLETKTGYCEYYATAMAVMLRATGIPARVSVGFLPGTLTTPADPAVGRDADTYTVSTSDAHAWVEVLFPRFGWIRFEPTPRSDGATMPPSPAELDPVLTERQQEAARDELGAQDAPEPVQPEPRVPEGQDIPPALDRDETASDGATGQGLAWRTIAVLLLATSAAGVGVAAYRRRPHHPELEGADRVLAAQQRVHAQARRYGLARRPSETAADVARRWTAEARTEADVAGRFVALTQAAAFGGRLDPRAGEEAEVLGERLSASLRASVDGRHRLLAPVRIPVETARHTARVIASRLLGR
jgi:transglutaminase-like putative cysteine protease